MGSWGFKAFDSDRAGEFMGDVQNLLAKPINKVNTTWKRPTAQQYYDAARAAAMSLLALSVASGTIGEDVLADAMSALDFMRHDEAWLREYTNPSKVKASIEADMALIAKQIGVMERSWKKLVGATKKRQRH